MEKDRAVKAWHNLNLETKKGRENIRKRKQVGEIDATATTSTENHAAIYKPALSHAVSEADAKQLTKAAWTTQRPRQQ